MAWNVDLAGETIPMAGERIAEGAGKFWIADLVDDKDITDIIYVIIGIAALVSIPTLFGRRWP